MLNAAPVDRRQLRQWQCTVCSAETLTCSTTDPQAQEAARGRVIGILLAGEIADAAAITTAMRCICFCYGQPMGQGLLIGKGLLRSERSAARPTNSCSDFARAWCAQITPPKHPSASRLA